MRALEASVRAFEYEGETARGALWFIRALIDRLAPFMPASFLQSAAYSQIADCL